MEFFMKKLFIYLFGLLILCFIIPALCANGARETLAIFKLENLDAGTDAEKNKENLDAGTDAEKNKEGLETGTDAEQIQENTENDEGISDKSKDNSKYEYSKYGIIRLLNTNTNEIQELPIDEYLLGVVSSEMPADFELEALKAQAVVARTYTIYQIINNSQKHENADICDSSGCCQAWITKENRLARWDENLRESNWAKIENAVNSTKGKIIVYNGALINAFFHSNSGGTTESSVNIWGQIEYPYLQSVETSGEEGYTQYSSEIVLTYDEFLSKIKEKYPKIQINFEEEFIKILEYNSSGRVKTLKIGNVQISGVEARTIFGLKSANFEILVLDNQITFSVKGYGHGVGMSQTGADSMAKSGSNYEEIIKHFYTGVEILNINSYSSELKVFTLSMIN
jgi:stage II sporulation protein D